jgi:hypothetical protein
MIKAGVRSQEPGEKKAFILDSNLFLASVLVSQAILVFQAILGALDEDEDEPSTNFWLLLLSLSSASWRLCGRSFFLCASVPT